MKLPWSKKKHLYTPHSAPITNGILHNSKWAVDANRSRNADRHVTFSLRRGNAQMSTSATHAAMQGAEVETARDGRRIIRRPPNDHDTGDPKTKTASRTRENRRTKDITSASVLNESPLSLGNARIPRYRPTYSSKQSLGDSPAENSVSSSDRWEPRGTTDTPNIPDLREERQQPRRRLSLLLDQKIEMKFGRISRERKQSSSTDIIKQYIECNSIGEDGAQSTRMDSSQVQIASGSDCRKSGLNGKPGANDITAREKAPQSRRRLSLLLDEKIAAKTRRGSQEMSVESSTEGVVPIVHKIKWNSQVCT